MFFFAAIHPKFLVKLIRLERYQGAYAIMTLIAEVGLMIYSIYFLVKEIKELKKEKREYFKVFQLFSASFKMLM